MISVIIINWYLKHNSILHHTMTYYEDFWFSRSVIRFSWSRCSSFSSYRFCSIFCWVASWTNWSVLESALWQSSQMIIWLWLCVRVWYCPFDHKPHVSHLHCSGVGHFLVFPGIVCEEKCFTESRKMNKEYGNLLIHENVTCISRLTWRISCIPLKIVSNLSLCYLRSNCGVIDVGYLPISAGFCMILIWIPLPNHVGTRW